MEFKALFKSYVEGVYRTAALLIKEEPFKLRSGGASHVYLNHRHFYARGEYLGVSAGLAAEDVKDLPGPAMNANELCSYLSAHGIDYERHDHPPVYTYEEADKYTKHLRGANLKNLFLRDGPGKRHFLVALSARAQLDLRALGAIVGAKLSFGSEERLKKYLGVGPGAVTLLAAINDPGHSVEVLIESGIWDSESFQCHPLENTATLVIGREGLQKFFELTGHLVRPISLTR